jgi:D-glycero-alpha-D-manno-heptose-7-phosphate kinase
MIITRTPFRISFFGGGTDFPEWYRRNGGAVLSTTIDKYCYISVRRLPPFFEYKHRIVYSKYEQVNDINEIVHPSVRETLRFMEIREGLEIHHDGDLPARSGLGSSSAFTVGLLHALYALKGKLVSRKRLALEAIHIEQNLIKENVGSQDQVAAAFGGLNKIEFRDNDIEVNPVPLSKDRLKLFQEHLLLFFSGFSRTASQIEAEKLKEMDNHKEELAELHKMVDNAIEILNGENGLKDFGLLLHEAWLLKKRLSGKVSNSFLDHVYQIARDNGALGGKALGAGGGGFLLFFVSPEDRERLLNALNFLTHVPFNFDSLGSQIIYYHEGA